MTNIFKDGFKSEIAEFKSTEKYSGALSGDFDPGEIAKEVLKGINWGELMAYCYRRFGPPNLGSDSYKDLVRWVITTPQEGLFLSVSPSPYEEYLLFGYITGREYQTKIIQEARTNFELNNQQFKKWCEKNNHPYYDIYNTPFEEKTSELIQISTELRKQFFSSSDYTEHKNCPIKKEGNKALERTLLDLTRPTYVRDVYISAKGIVDDNDSKLKHSVEYAHTSGHVTPSWILKDPKLYSKLMATIYQNFGNTPEDLEKAIKYLEQK